MKNVENKVELKERAQNQNHKALIRRIVTLPQIKQGDVENGKIFEEDCRKSLDKHNEWILWIPFLSIMLGVRLVVEQLTFSYQNLLLNRSGVLNVATVIAFRIPRGRFEKST